MTGSSPTLQVRSLINELSDYTTLTVPRTATLGMGSLARSVYSTPTRTLLTKVRGGGGHTCFSS